MIRVTGAGAEAPPPHETAELMKTVLKWLLRLILLLVLIVVVFVGYVYWRSSALLAKTYGVKASRGDHPVRRNLSCARKTPGRKGLALHRVP